MSRVITFSRTFPAYHPNKEYPTFFVEKFMKSQKAYHTHFDWVNWAFFNICTPKYHTIRAGNRWKKGEYFSPRVWSGKPYQSKMITIAPDIEIKKIWDFEIQDGLILIDNKVYAYSSSTELLDKLAENDGLSQFQLLDWFQYPKPFKGQIICWNESINY